MFNYKLNCTLLWLSTRMIIIGSNNNPTPYQFKCMCREILLGVTDKIVKHANVTLQDSTDKAALIPSVNDKVDFICDHYDFDDLN